jgi:hypothetical protein
MSSSSQGWWDKSNNNEGQQEANCLNRKMESTSNNTLQLKYDKQLNVKMSRATYKKNPINQFLEILVTGIKYWDMWQHIICPQLWSK